MGINNNDFIASLIARSLAGETSPEEEAALQSYLATDAGTAAKLEALRKVWDMPGVQAGSMPPFSQPDDAHRLGRLLEKAQKEAGVKEKKPAIHRFYRPFLKYAAILIVVAGTAWMFTNLFTKPAAATTLNKKITTEKGSKSRMLLPDGSTVTLNAGSTLYYSNDFSGKTREVRLVGEAFFEVAKQPGRPFIVHVADIDITVLGTVFNVKSYAGDSATETTLLSGLVQITRSRQKNQPPIFLHPHQKITMPHSPDCLPEKDTDSATASQTAPMANEVVQLDSLVSENSLPETGWVYNRLEFRKESFGELAEKMERWYGINIIFADERLKTYRFNGSFERETVAEAFRALQKTAPFTFKIIKNEVFIDTPD